MYNIKRIIIFKIYNISILSFNCLVFDINNRLDFCDKLLDVIRIFDIKGYCFMGTYFYTSSATDALVRINSRFSVNDSSKVERARLDTCSATITLIKINFNLHAFDASAAFSLHTRCCAILTQFNANTTTFTTEAS